MTIKYRFRNGKEITLYKGKYSWKIYRFIDRIIEMLLGVNILVEFTIGEPTVMIYYKA